MLVLLLSFKRTLSLQSIRKIGKNPLHYIFFYKPVEYHSRKIVWTASKEVCWEPLPLSFCDTVFTNHTVFYTKYN